jgi:hypothetical protein
MSADELAAGAAGFGTGNVDANAAVLSSLSPTARRHVKAVMALTPEALAVGAAGFGTGRCCSGATRSTP